MGCCCQGLSVTGIPNDIPTPPPMCYLLYGFNSVVRYEERLGGGLPTQAEYDTMWTTFSNSPAWKYIVPSPRHPTPESGLSHSQLLWRSAAVANRIIAINESRLMLIISLRPALTNSPVTWGSAGSLRDVYGVGQLSIKCTNQYYGSERFLPRPFTFSSPSYSQIWSTVDVSWGMLDAADVNFPSGFAINSLPINYLSLTGSLHQNGLTDLATNSLSTGVTASGSNVAVDTFGTGAVDIDISSLVDETGGDFLLVVAQVPSSAISKQTFPAAGQGATYGPISRQYPTFFDYEFDILGIWGCIISMTVRIDIDIRNASSIVEEDRTKGATYLSGTGLTKKFRITDNESAPGSPTTDTFTSSGSFEVPSGVSTITSIECWGGGGGGAQDGPGGDGGGGGGGGGYAKSTNVAVTPGSTINYTVGAGGAGGSENGTDGGDTTFHMTIGEGGSGASGRNGGAGGGGTGTTTFTGGTGGTSDLGGGGGGSSAGTASNGNNGASATDDTGAAGGAAPTGGGAGANGGDENSNGDAAVEVGGGGGGGGGDASTGGAGFRGQIKVTYNAPVTTTRQCDIFLTQSASVYYLNFDYLREVDPNDSTYYIEPDPAFGNQSHTNTVAVGSGQTYETIGDLEGVELSFTHDGTNDNATPANGTEDATVKITIENFTIGQ